MDSLPADFLVHPQPLMATIGLLESNLISPLSGNLDASLTQNSLVSEKRKQHENILKSTRDNLRNSINSRNSVNVWDHLIGRNSNLFYVVNLPKNHTFPQRKVTSGDSLDKQITCSPMSPLCQSSELYNDGIFTSDWVHKHREIIPSVIVLYHELWQRVNPIDKRDIAAYQQAMQLERERDTILCQEITETRKITQDRPIRFAVVLLIADHSQEIQLEDRLNFIRKSCQLDNKSLFVMPPQTEQQLRNDLTDFLKFVERTLWDASISYYKDMTKKIMKKRKSKIYSVGKTSGNLGSTFSFTQVPNTSGGSKISKPLPAQGWNIRYDFKLGCFAEMRQDFTNAIKHYEDAYNTLMELLRNYSISGSPVDSNAQKLQINSFYELNTKRWAEARQLANVLSFKISKLCFYLESPIGSLRMLNAHIENFKEMPDFKASSPIPLLTGLPHQASTTGNYLYYGWLSTQYQLFAELLVLAVEKIDLKLPFPNPATRFDSYLSSIIPPGTTYPNIVIEHPGYYFRIAAKCAKQRQILFQEIKKIHNPGLDDSNDPYSESGLLSLEHAFNHSELIIELLTKSYEQFKSIKAARTSLMLAYEIAVEYHKSSDHEMAFKFFEKIIQSYQKEGWPEILVHILELLCEVGKKTKRFEVVASCLVELLYYKKDSMKILSELWGLVDGKCTEVGEDGASVVTDLPVSLNSTVNMDQIHSFISCTACFRNSITHLDSSTSIQIKLSPAESNAIPDSFELSEILVKFNNSAYDFKIQHDFVSEDHSLTYQDTTFNQCTTFVQRTYSANLAFMSASETKIFECVFMADDCQDLEIMQVVAIMRGKVHGGVVNMEFPISNRDKTLFEIPKWINIQESETGSVLKYEKLEAENYTKTTIMPKQMKINIDLVENEDLYLDDIQERSVVISNEDKDFVYAYLELFVHSTEATRDTFISESIEDLQTETVMIKIGSIPPKKSHSCNFFVQCLHSPYDRVINASLTYSRKPIGTLSDSSSQSSPASTMKKEAKWTMKVLKPFEVTGTYHPYYDTTPGKVFLNSNVPCFQMLNVSFKSNLSCFVSGIELMKSGEKISAKNVTPSDGDSSINRVWGQGETVTESYVLQMERDALETSLNHVGDILVSWKRRPEDDREIKSFLKLPVTLKQLDDVEISLICPSETSKGKLMTITYILRNNTMKVIDIDVHVETSESFVFSGMRNATKTLFPLSSLMMNYNVFALEAGQCVLPKLKVKKKEKKEQQTGSAVSLVPEETTNEEDYFTISGASSDLLSVFVRP